MPIWEHGFHHPVRTGITFAESLPGCVPEYEEREAAVYCHYRPAEFRRLPVKERARIVAQYRIHSLVESHAQDAVIQDSERKTRR